MLNIQFTRPEILPRLKKNKWLSLYILIIILTATTTLIVLSLSNNILNGEFTYTNESFTASVGQNTDSIFTESKQTIYQISNCAELRRFVCGDYLNDKERIYASLELSETMHSFVAGSYWVGNVIVYSDKQERAVDTDSSTNPLDYYKSNLKDYITWDSFKNIISSINDDYYICFGNDPAHYLVNVVRKSYNKCPYTIAVMINVDKIFENFAHSDFTDRGLFGLLCEDGTLLIYDNGNITAEKSELDYAELRTEQTKSRSLRFRDTEYLVSSANSDVDGFVFLLFDDYTRINSATLMQQVLIILLFLISISLSGNYIYKYMRSNTEHLKHLLRNVHYESPDIDIMYNRLEIYMDKLTSRNSEMEKQLDNQRISIVKNKLCNLLEYSRAELDELTASLADLDIIFNYNYFAVIGFYILDCEHVFGENSEDEDTAKNAALCRFILENIFEEIISEQLAVYFTVSNGILTGIVNLPSAEGNEQLKKCIKRGEEFTEAEFSFKYYTHISAVINDIGGVHGLYTGMLADFERVVFGHGDDGEAVDLSAAGKAFSAEELSNESMTEVLSFINKNLGSKELGVPMICDHMGVSSTKLSREFKAAVGETVARYIQLKRVELAKKLLLGTDKPVNEIADEAGYDYAVSFIRAFKRTEKMTPSEYRSLHKEQQK